MIKKKRLKSIHLSYRLLQDRNALYYKIVQIRKNTLDFVWKFDLQAFYCFYCNYQFCKICTNSAKLPLGFTCVFVTDIGCEQ